MYGRRRQQESRSEQAEDEWAPVKLEGEDAGLPDVTEHPAKRRRVDPEWRDRAISGGEWGGHESPKNGMAGDGRRRHGGSRLRTSGRRSSSKGRTRGSQT